MIIVKYAMIAIMKYVVVFLLKRCGYNLKYDAITYSVINQPRLLTSRLMFMDDGIIDHTITSPMISLICVFSSQARIALLINGDRANMKRNVEANHHTKEMVGVKILNNSLIVIVCSSNIKKINEMVTE